MFSMLLRLCFTFFIAYSVLAMPNGQATGSELSTSNTVTNKPITIKLKYLCYLIKMLGCVYYAEVDDKIVAGQSANDEDELLNSQWGCQLRPDSSIEACILARVPKSSSRPDLRMLTVWYKNKLAKCPCFYKYWSFGSSQAKSCECEIVLSDKRVKYT
jgi:hypothetical protein